MTSMCNPQLLNVLVAKKEFRIISAPIFQHVQMNADLPLESKFLWTVLWELCSVNKHYEKNLTWGFLAKRLNRSPASIRRWAKHLIKFGYLKVSEVFSADGSQLPSKFQIGVPQDIAKKVWKVAPDRYVKPALNSEQTSADSESGSGSESSESDGVVTADTGVTDDSADANQKSEESSESDGANAGTEVIQPAYSGVIDQRADAKLSNADACAGNESTVVKSGVKNTVSRMEERLNKLSKLGGKGSVSSHSASSPKKRLDVQGETETAYEREIREIAERAAKLEKSAKKRGGEGVIKSALEGVIKSGTQESDFQKQENNNNEALIEQVKGDLMARLEGNHDFETLSEQVAVSIRKGSFKKFPYQKAINVAAKLVRENRWKKPRVGIYA